MTYHINSQRRITIILLALLITTFCNAQPMTETKQYKIKITIADKVVAATLYDNATTRDFVNLLPLSVEMKDYNSTEKIFDPPKKLSTDGAPSGTDPDIGDITYYAPWGNVAIFYKDFGYSNGLVKLGKIDGPMELFKTPGSLKANIELTEK
jgi:hypothetical protein